MHIVLHQPEIPANTGNIGRTCVATGTSLHLIEPFGFRLNEKEIRRAGMDYWEKLDVTRYMNFDTFYEQYRTYAEQLAGYGFEQSVEQTARLHDRQDAAFRDGQSVGQQAGCAVGGRKPRLWMATTKAKRAYTEADFGPDDFIMFGKESAGIPEEILVEHEEDCIRIPMLPEIRSLNLSNAVAIVLYEALRQNNFASMQRAGELHRLHWKEDQKDDQ